MTEPLPCPFCGHVGVTHNEGSTFRWLTTECNGCGAQCGEERIDTLSKDQGAAISQALEAAIKTWNTRAAQPQQQAEPVAWMVYTQDGQSVYVTDNPTDIQEGQRALPLYTTPPQRQWVGLTDAEWEPLYDKLAKYQEYGAFVSGWDNFARAIEAKLKEKNRD